jgi:hypothetical protein
VSEAKSKDEILASKVGLKFDGGKPDMTLVTTIGLEPCVRALEYGEKKYSRLNFAKGMEIKRLLAAAKRHIDAICEGQWYDPESGVAHLGHAQTSLYMLAHIVAIGTVKDVEVLGLDPSDMKVRKEDT